MKKETMIARGIRFTKKSWRNVTTDANQQALFPSDIVRKIVDEYYEKKKKKK